MLHVVRVILFSSQICEKTKDFQYSMYHLDINDHCRQLMYGYLRTDNRSLDTSDKLSEATTHRITRR